MCDENIQVTPIESTVFVRDNILDDMIMMCNDNEPDNEIIVSKQISRSIRTSRLLFSKTLTDISKFSTSFFNEKYNHLQTLITNNSGVFDERHRKVLHKKRYSIMYYEFLSHVLPYKVYKWYIRGKYENNNKFIILRSNDEPIVRHCKIMISILLINRCETIETIQKKWLNYYISKVFCEKEESLLKNYLRFLKELMFLHVEHIDSEYYK